MNFHQLGLSKPLLKSLEKNGYRQPTPIQQKSIGAVLKRNDLMATAQTGTGKTAAFTLPLLQLLSESTAKPAPRALIITPTRELAAQVLASVQTYGQSLSLQACSVYGGVKIGPQIRALKKGMDIVVATPGRLLDLHQQNAIDLSSIEILVLDEADRMLDMGFIPDIKRIQAKLPTRKQSLMFSATFSPEVRQLAETMLDNPRQIDVAPRNTTARSIKQCVIPVDKARKTELLHDLLDRYGNRQSLVFTRTKHGANKLAKLLNKNGTPAEAIHGNKSQAHRRRVLEEFKQGKVTTLVATDIASRGLDISDLPLVINFELPNVAEDYVHRIGRTGRAGATGNALSLVCADEAEQLFDIEDLIKYEIPREEVEGFEPVHALPVNRKKQRPSSNLNQGKRKRAPRRRRSNNTRKAA